MTTITIDAFGGGTFTVDKDLFSWAMTEGAKYIPFRNPHTDESYPLTAMDLDTLARACSRQLTRTINLLIPLPGISLPGGLSGAVQMYVRDGASYGITLVAEAYRENVCELLSQITLWPGFTYTLWDATDSSQLVETSIEGLIAAFHRALEV